MVGAYTRAWRRRWSTTKLDVAALKAMEVAVTAAPRQPPPLAASGCRARGGEDEGLSSEGWRGGGYHRWC